jgi:hypothetical protein
MDGGSIPGYIPPGLRFGIIIDEPLIGVKNGSNKFFALPDKFMADRISVYRNGHRLLKGTSPANGDYLVYEPGGIGTGYTGVQFLLAAPMAIDELMADYAVAAP